MAVLHASEKILNAKDTVTFDDSMLKIDEMHDWIKSSGALIGQLSNSYSSIGSYTMPSLGTNLNNIASNVTNNNTTGGNLIANIHNTFNNTISSNVDANRVNNDAVKQITDKLNYLSNKFRS